MTELLKETNLSENINENGNKMENKNSINSNADNRLYTKIYDRVYDITDFIYKHPGGTVLRYVVNEDGTEAFESFHTKGHKNVNKYLQAIPSRPYDAFKDASKFNITQKSEELIKDFKSLRKSFEDRGLFNPSYTHIFFRVFEVTAFFFVHFYMLSQAKKHGCLYTLMAIVLGALGGGRAGWLQHEGGHSSLTTNTFIDKCIQKMGISFGLITHNKKWNDMHNKHHATPQKVDHDPDIDTLPFVALYPEALSIGRRRHMVMKWWIRYQHLSFCIFSSALNVFFWHFYLHPREYLFRKFDPITLGFVMLRYIVHIWCSYSTFGFGGALATLMLTMFLSGVYLFINFSLNHTYLPVMPKNSHSDWVTIQTEYTCNINPTYFANWWMGYLNCQIEHHLFPTMPQFRQPGITKEIQAFCEQHSLNYRTYTYWQAILNMLGNLKHIAENVDELSKPIIEDKVCGYMNLKSQTTVKETYTETCKTQTVTQTIRERHTTSPQCIGA